MTKIKIQIFITGKVQGVGFRYSTVEVANRLGIVGWVKNLYDGSVEAVFEGEEETLKKMIEWCKQGPPLAKVENIEIYHYSYVGEYNNFQIKG